MIYVLLIPKIAVTMKRKKKKSKKKSKYKLLKRNNKKLKNKNQNQDITNLQLHMIYFILLQECGLLVIK